MKVKSAIGRASRGLPISGMEALTICSLLELADTLQMTVKTATKEDPDCYNRFLPIAQLVISVLLCCYLSEHCLIPHKIFFPCCFG